jgi:phosphatidylethanolamine/phosphatidyl-N-methylethanolamine N-methyltransferase
MHHQDSHISQADVLKTYNFYAPIYDYLFGKVLEPGRRALSGQVNALKPESLLEVGVGTGLLLPTYPIQSKITGVDISAAMLEIAKQRARLLPHVNIHLEVMDAEALKFPDESFDCVVLPYVLSVTPDPDALVKEVRRVCRKNGTIILVNHFSGSGTWYLLEKLVKNLAERIGFRSEFSYEANVLKHDWQVVLTQTVNLFGLSKLIVIRNV